MFTVIHAPQYPSANSYMPYLKAAKDALAEEGFREAEELYIDRNDYGRRLVYRDKYIITCTNSSYILIDNDSTQEKVLEIKQNKEGIDTEDRIIALKNFIKQNNL